MTVAIHQPNFLPWLGYFHKIARADTFVFIDHVEFVKGHICNRNKIKNNQSEAVWITVPVKHDKGLSVNYNELKIDYSQQWGVDILNQFRGSYAGAPYYKRYFDILEGYLREKEYPSLAALNIDLIAFCCEELNIDTRLEVVSEQGKDFGEKNEMNVNICNHFGADTYLSGQGAKKYNDEELFRENGIKLVYQQFEHPEYPQQHKGFVPNLSVIDLLMNCGPEKSRKVLFGES